VRNLLISRASSSFSRTLHHGVSRLLNYCVITSGQCSKWAGITYWNFFLLLNLILALINVGILYPFIFFPFL
jgi:hypothetical protein